MKKITLTILVLAFSVVRAQLRSEARWCCINDKEMAKCQALKAAIAKRDALNLPYPGNLKKYSDLPFFDCVQSSDPYTCMDMIGKDVPDADLMQLDPGMGYTAGEFYNLMPLMAEKYTLGTAADGLTFTAVAIVRKDRPDINVNNLQGKRACFSGVGQAAGWVYPISWLIQTLRMPIVECNVPVKSAAEFFGDTCAPNALTRYYNPFGNNPASVCKNCKGLSNNLCTSNDPYAGYAGAFECVSNGDGDVAFVRDSTVAQEVANSTTVTTADFQLLCQDGTRTAIENFAQCNWGVISSHIVMTSAMRAPELRQDYQDLLALLSFDFGAEGAHQDIFQMFESDIYGASNLMFTDVTKSLFDVGTRDTYYGWAGPHYRDKLLLLNSCPLKQVRWCVTSADEMAKCENMIMAFAARSLKPDLNCIMGTSVQDCMLKISLGDADLITLDAADVYTAGKYYNLVPIIAEDYSGYDVLNAGGTWEAPSYFVVAVARRIDSYLTAFNLKGRRSCHPGVYTAAGWVVPIDKLRETGQINVVGCNVYLTLGQYFSKSCIPGVLDSDYNPHTTNPVNLCEACSSGGQDRCMRNSEENYFGHSGAFRCLTEKGGDVAYIRHTTPRENTDGRNNAEWARNRRSNDYELLCNDGTRKDVDFWSDCNQGQVPSNAIVTADFKTAAEREIFWTLLNFGQQFFAADNNPDFPMFQSALEQKDLMFQDATVRLVLIPTEYQNYEAYLGNSFVRAMRRMEHIDCVTKFTSSTAATTHPLVYVTVLVVALSLSFYNKL